MDLSTEEFIEEIKGLFPHGEEEEEPSDTNEIP